MKIKTLDTNVLLDSSFENILASFAEPTCVVIPLTVIKELDHFKKGNDLINEICRSNTRFLDKLRSVGKLAEGVEYNEHIIQVIATHDDLDLEKNDHKIIKTAKEVGGELLSQDINVRIVADVVGVQASNYAPNHVDAKQLYTGIAHIDIDGEDATVMGQYQSPGIQIYDNDLVNNQFIIMHDELGGTYEGIYRAHDRRILPLKTHYKAWGISPKKDKEGVIIPEQKFAMHALLDPKIDFVTILGPSGTGKTLLTLATGLEQTLNMTDRYNKIIVMRPLVAIGADIGFLPGTKEEKLESWMGSTFDNLGQLLTSYAAKDQEIGMYINQKEKVFDLMHQDRLELEAMTYIRGRSIPRAFIIVDDAQNLTQREAASIITRAGEGTKVVFLGDISEKQIDNHRLTPNNNGLAYVVEAFKGDDIVAHIAFTRKETIVRSRLAQLGVEKL